MTTIEIPRLVGSRESAAKLTAELPDDLTGARVVIDARAMLSASQSFSDELCKQVLQIRNAALLEIKSASPTFARYLNASATIRGVSSALKVDVRPLG